MRTSLVLSFPQPPVSGTGHEAEALGFFCPPSPAPRLRGSRLGSGTPQAPGGAPPHCSRSGSRGEGALAGRVCRQRSPSSSGSLGQGLALSIVTAFARPEKCSGNDCRGKTKTPKTPLVMESMYLNPEFEVQPESGTGCEPGVFVKKARWLRQPHIGETPACLWPCCSPGWGGGGGSACRCVSALDLCEVSGPGSGRSRICLPGGNRELVTGSSWNE